MNSSWLTTPSPSGSNRSITAARFCCCSSHSCFCFSRSAARTAPLHCPKYRDNWLPWSRIITFRTSCFWRTASFAAVDHTSKHVDDNMCRIRPIAFWNNCSARLIRACSSRCSCSFRRASRDHASSPTCVLICDSSALSLRETVVCSSSTAAWRDSSCAVLFSVRPLKCCSNSIVREPRPRMSSATAIEISSIASLTSERDACVAATGFVPSLPAQDSSHPSRSNIA